MTPLRARLADWLSIALALTTIVGAVTLSFTIAEPNAIGVIVLFACPAVAYMVSKFTLYQVLQKNVSVLFTPNEFAVSTLLGTKRYDRNMPHKFVLYIHDRADREEEVLSFREGKWQHHWWAWKLKRYFGKSYHLSFDYLDQRNILLTVYKRKNAHKILTRLNAVRQVMDNETNHGTGQALSPEQDWSRQAGALHANLNAGTL